jgi:hypothetical protein
MIAFRDATGMRPESVSDWQDGVTWLRLTEDFGSARQLRKLGRMSYIGWLRSIRGKRVHAVLAADDLRPFFKFYGRYLRRQFGKLKRASGLPTLNRDRQPSFSNRAGLAFVVIGWEAHSLCRHARRHQSWIVFS